jgi:hypothetical protein
VAFSGSHRLCVYWGVGAMAPTLPTIRQARWPFQQHPGVAVRDCTGRQTSGEQVALSEYTAKAPFMQSTAAAPMLLLTLAAMAAGVIMPYTAFGANGGAGAAAAGILPVAGGDAAGVLWADAGRERVVYAEVWEVVVKPPRGRVSPRTPPAGRRSRGQLFDVGAIQVPLACVRTDESVERAIPLASATVTSLASIESVHLPRSRPRHRGVDVEFLNGLVADVGFSESVSARVTVAES